MKVITGLEFKKALINSYACLSNEKNKIDALNVFPVPDGDTGTNMLLTYTSGIEALNNVDDEDVSVVLKTFSRGLLMGARGNSGVILSQIFRGMSKSIDQKTSITTTEFVKSLIEARDTSYKAVMNPVEGTILTVISDIANDVSKFKDEDFKKLLSAVVEAGEKSLKNTPNLLPVLKEAGVVDSGGYGLMVIISGIKDYFEGNLTKLENEIKVFDSAGVTGESTEFGYCTEFIFTLDEVRCKKNKFSEQKLKQQLSKLGDSLVVVHDEDIVKVHVHTLVPGEALNIGQMYGEFIRLKIENMTLQHEEIINMTPEMVDYAIISVSPGSGISKMFLEYGATNIIDGGQTMNPSTSDFVSIIKQANAKNVIILPNNSNIIMAATQAKELIEDSSDINVEVIPTKSIIHGLASLSFFNNQADIKTNALEMEEAYSEVKYGELTYAVRDTNMNGVEVTAGDYISIFDKAIIVSTSDKLSALKQLIDAMVDNDSSVINLIYGKDVDASELSEVKKVLSSSYSDFEIEVYSGDQDVYSYFIGVE